MGEIVTDHTRPIYYGRERLRFSGVDPRQTIAAGLVTLLSVGTSRLSFHGPLKKGIVPSEGGFTFLPESEQIVNMYLAR